jgi:cytochrome P450
MDLLEDFAAPLAVTVIAELLGVPEPGRGRLRLWSSDIVAMYELGHTEAQAERAVQAVEEFSAFLRALAAERRRQPQDDLISALAQAEDGGQRLNEAELIASCILLLNAGHEATVHALANGIFALLRHPEQLERLRRDPALVGPALEEMLRYDTPVPIFRRWVLEDLEFNGCQFARGSRVALVYGAANRDPARFANPHEFDLARSPNPHLSFGGGIHYCMGAPLARAELQIAVNTLLRRLPRLRLSGPDPARKPTFVFRGLQSLPVLF